MDIYNIGSKVKTLSAEDAKTIIMRGALAYFDIKHRGEIGTITDAFYASDDDGCDIYEVMFQDGLKRMFSANLLTPYYVTHEPISSSWSYEFDFADNCVVAILFENKNGEKREVMRGHGHIIHGGILGFAQAASYALKKIYEKMDGGYNSYDR